MRLKPQEESVKENNVILMLTDMACYEIPSRQACNSIKSQKNSPYEYNRFKKFAKGSSSEMITVWSLIGAEKRIFFGGVDIKYVLSRL